MLKKLYIVVLPVMVLLFPQCGCGNSNGRYFPEGDTISLHYATNLTMIDYGSFMQADFRNPWDTTRILQTYLLVPKDAPLPEHLPAGVVVRTPLSRSLVYPAAHISLIDELGATHAVVGVCDLPYMHNSRIKERVNDGRITDCGLSMTPNIEKILLLEPDAILLSAFENSNDHNKVGQIGVPIIDCTDYMESSPLGRAEWMRFYGRLYGKGVQADSLFSVTEKAYLGIMKSMQGVSNRPRVMFDLIYGQSWSVPGDNSTTGVMIAHAGGQNIFSTYKKSGGVMLSPEEVLFRASDADIWLVRYTQEAPLTISQMGQDNNIYTKFVPYKTGEIYGCNTNYSTYYDEESFHPHWLLAEYAALLHPELEIETYGKGYFHKLER